MDVRVESATVGGFAIAGGANGVYTTKLSWKKSPRTSRIVRPRAHGSVDLTRYYSGRLYELSGLIYGLDAVDAQARLDAFEQAIALTGSSFTFRFTLAGRSEAEQAQVLPDGDLEYEFAHESRSMIRWALTLFSEDPRRYTLTPTTGSYDPSGGGSLTVSNDGNFKTPPIFTLIGPATNPVITDGTDEIDLTGLTLTSSDTLVVDVGARAVTLNDVSRPDLIVASSTTWFELEPGSTNLQVTGTGFSAGVTSFSVSFHDARI